MARPITFKVIARRDGTVELKLPEGATQQKDAGALASFTDKLSKLIGRVKERHIGRDENGVHVHDHNTEHHHH